MSDTDINDERKLPAGFDVLMKYDGVQFKKAVIACLKVLYNFQVNTGEKTNENFKRLDHVLRALEESAKKPMTAYQELEEKVKALSEKVLVGKTGH